MRIVRFLILCLVVASTSTCKKNPNEPSDTDPNPGATNLSNGSFAVYFDGAWFNANLSIAAQNLAANTFVLTALDNAGRSVSVSIRVTAPGTYAFSGSNFGVCQIVVGSATWVGGPSALQGSGEVTFTVFNAQRATGTFHCTAPAFATSTAVGTKLLTNGTFNVTF